MNDHESRTSRPHRPKTPPTPRHAGPATPRGRGGKRAKCQLRTHEMIGLGMRLRSSRSKEQAPGKQRGFCPRGPRRGRGSSDSGMSGVKRTLRRRKPGEHNKRFQATACPSQHHQRGWCRGAGYARLALGTAHFFNLTGCVSPPRL